MSIPFKSLDAATAAGVGISVDLEDVVAGATIQVTSTGAPTTCRATLEGSLDGVNWFTMPSGSSVVLDGTSGTSALASVGGPMVRFLRAHLTSLSGGTSPTVTAWVVGL